MSNPLDDYLMEKEAGLGDVLRGAWRGITGAAQPGAQGALFGGAQAFAPGRLASLQQGWNLGQKAQGPALVAAGTAALAAGTAAVNKIRESIGRRQDFKAMMEIDPELKDLQAERPAFFNQAYNSLRRLNPAFGSDPIVSGSFMRKMMANPDAAGLTLAQTVKAPAVPPSATSFNAEVGPFKIGM
jgi:hypothetical protein